MATNKRSFEIELIKLQFEEHKNIWSNFVNKKIISGKIRPIIKTLWLECDKLDLSPFSSINQHIISTDDYLEIRSKNINLIEAGVPIMNEFYNYVLKNGFLVILADQMSNILEVVGDRTIIEQAKKINLRPGVCWDGQTVGPNGIGTTLHLGEPFSIYGYEHYVSYLHNWMCFGAPIHSLNRHIVGAICILCPHAKPKDNQAMANISILMANSIERQRIELKKGRSYQFGDYYKKTVFDTIEEGVLTVSTKGQIIVLNKMAAQFLGLKSTKYKDMMLSEVIDRRNKYIIEISQGRRFPTEEEVMIYRHDSTLRCLISAKQIEGDIKGVLLVFKELKKAREIAQRMVGAKAKISFEDLIGKDSNFNKMIDHAKAIAVSSSNVLLLGESGTGKDVFAQAIHNASPRRRGPFVAINCAATPRDLLAGELFGYEEGAFTGARRGGNPGKFELADGGTIFLDEIGEMSPESQVLLLRVLEEKKVIRIGGKEIIPVDVRVIAATNKDLSTACIQGDFRYDLYYRLNVISLKLIPLRERPDDIELLIRHFIDKFNQQLGKSVREIDQLVLDKLIRYSWPGNIRELQNVIERAINIVNGPALTMDLLPDGFNERKIMPFIRLTSEEQEVTKIRNLLEVHQGNISRIAKKLGISRSTLYRKIYKYRLDEQIR